MGRVVAEDAGIPVRAAIPQLPAADSEDEGARTALVRMLGRADVGRPLRVRLGAARASVLAGVGVFTVMLNAAAARCARRVAVLEAVLLKMHRLHSGAELGKASIRARGVNVSQEPRHRGGTQATERKAPEA